MILTRRIALNGISLDQVDSCIVIQSIEDSATHDSTQTVNLMAGQGQRVTDEHWEAKEIAVNYGINVPKRDLRRRREIYEAVNAWARAKGWVTVNWIPGKRLWADKVVLPSAGDLFEWTSVYPIIFRAYNVPFWQDAYPAKTVTGTTASGQTTVRVGGDVNTPIDVSFVNKSGGTVNSIRVTAGGKTIQLSGIGLSAGAEAKITHGTDGLLRITAGGVSVYSKYSGHDDLTVTPGNVTIAYSADGAGVWTFQHYGRYI